VSTGDVDYGGEPEYRSLPVVADSTGGLRHDGVVRLRLPSMTLPSVGVPEPDPDGVGAGSFPPALDDPRPVLFWLRAYPVSGSPEIPAVRWVGVNATSIVQAVTAAPEFLGTGTGAADQQYPLAHRPVQAPAMPVVVEVEEQGVWRPWTPVDSFVGTRPDDRVWVLDAEAGTVTFGTTLSGRAPQIGERIRARRYRYGGGVAGNVAAGAVSALESGEPVRVRNPLPTAGGAAPESLAEGLDRIPAEFRRHDRAVAASDFAELALASPGAEVGRAECLPLFHPPSRDLAAAGVVTVVVWPREDAAHPDAPTPSRGLLRRVCAHLNPRRLVTTELYVVPPAYRTVAVSVAVVAKPAYSADAVRRWVELVLRQYLAPLPPYGPEGRGWPLGRQVFGPELQAAALQVEGVDYLAALDVAELAADSTSWIPRDPVVLEPWEVVALGAITVVAGTTAPPFGTAPPPPETTGPVVPVPTRTERC
jgi:predicted phage baseplate assembly protein